jgi:hypothetical protein
VGSWKKVHLSSLSIYSIKFSLSPPPQDFSNYGHDYEDIKFKFTKFGGHFHHEVKTGS